jgi:hypothetical protein
VLQIITLQLCCNELLIINTLLNAKTQQFSSVLGTSQYLNLGQLLGKPLCPSDRSIFMPPFSIVSYKLLTSVAWIPNDAGFIFSRLILDASVLLCSRRCCCWHRTCWHRTHHCGCCVCWALNTCMVKVHAASTSSPVQGLLGRTAPHPIPCHALWVPPSPFHPPQPKVHPPLPANLQHFAHTMHRRSEDERQCKWGGR